MPPNVLGRTNRTFPSVWLRPTGGSPEVFAACVATGLPVDITGQAALGGHAVRGSSSPVVYCLSDDYLRSSGYDFSHQVVQAEIVQLLSCLGRPSADIVLLPIRRRPEDTQMSGALDALQEAREDGLIQHLGFKATGGPFAVMSTWTLYDAFELALLPGDNAELLALVGPLAAERRVGVVFTLPLPLSLGGEGWGEGVSSGPVIYPVASVADIDRLAVLA